MWFWLKFRAAGGWWIAAKSDTRSVTSDVNLHGIWFWLKFREADGLPIAAKINVQLLRWVVAR